jgi:putative peptidoglycan lipid II flippase
VASDSRTVAIWTMVSRISGLGKFIAIAAVLGPTCFGNLFQTANILPNIVHELVIGSLFSAILVPVIGRHVDADDKAEVSRLVGGFLSVALSISALVTVLLIAAGPVVIALVTAAVSDAEIRQQQQAIGWPLLALLMPQIFFYCIAATGVAVQHAHRRFAFAAAAPSLENFGIIVVMGVFTYCFGLGTELDQVTAPQILLLGAGTTAAVMLHAGAQWWAAWRLGTVLRPRLVWQNRALREIFHLALPSSGYAALNSVNYLAMFFVAGAVPGGAVAFQIGLAFLNLPVAICARPVAAAQLPRLSKRFR